MNCLETDEDFVFRQYFLLRLRLPFHSLLSHQVNVDGCLSPIRSLSRVDDYTGWLTAILSAVVKLDDDFNDLLLPSNERADHT